MPKILECGKIKGILSEESGANNLVFRTVFSHKDGSRLVISYNDVLPGGNTKNHAHPEEHVAFIVKGEGVLDSGDGNPRPISEGMAIYIPSDEQHCFRNTGDKAMVIFGVKPEE